MVTGIANGQQGASIPIAMVNSNMTSPVQTEQKKSSGDNRRKLSASIWQPQPLASSAESVAWAAVSVG
ncbi:hypothetical protein RR46_07438 [Papilio xuthus]|uniref:Uncharacterized protein n=1 Tax=Papilio xuthus TaxID=66420 RepID=A0A194PWD7_PAPXU|nr:hypothetical protein RR46_07438 [Papilio xuthus]